MYSIFLVSSKGIFVGSLEISRLGNIKPFGQSSAFVKNWVFAVGIFLELPFQLSLTLYFLRVACHPSTNLPCFLSMENVVCDCGEVCCPVGGWRSVTSRVAREYSSPARRHAFFKSVSVNPYPHSCGPSGWKTGKVKPSNAKNLLYFVFSSVAKIEGLVLQSDRCLIFSTCQTGVFGRIPFLTMNRYALFYPKASDMSSSRRY